MTLHGFKTDIVENKKVLSSDEFKKFMIKLFLFIGLGMGTIGFAVNAIVGSLFTMIVIIFSIGLLGIIIEFCTEDAENVIKVRSFIKLWYIWIPIFIVTFVALKLFKFI